ncbi:hypothetical protein QUF74_13605 [Candidatus Halobeggiatoa sp. HSG11]|nr:hypothetical protein [Candidatus Halobeggiatoa sp. HSG11]
MLQTIEAILNPDGKITLPETVKITSPQKILVTIFEEQPINTNFKTALLDMPYVGEDKDFQRKQDNGRDVEIFTRY